MKNSVDVRTKELTYISPVEEEDFADVITEPTLEERLEQTEQLLQATTMAFTEFIFSQTMGK